MDGLSYPEVASYMEFNGTDAQKTLLSGAVHWFELLTSPDLCCLWCHLLLELDRERHDHRDP